jgi:hypothetical protein
MDKRIIYAAPDGGCCVIIPAPGMDIEAVAAKDVPAGATYRVVDASEIPTDRTWRAAWVMSGAGGPAVSMDRARAMVRAATGDARADTARDLIELAAIRGA